MILTGEYTLRKGIEDRGEKKRGLFLSGLWLLCLWYMSHYVEWPVERVLSSLDRSVQLLDSGFLLISMTILVATNAVRAFFLYTGWFLLGICVSGKSRGNWLEWVVPLFGIPVCYVAAGFFHFPSVPHFGIPAVFALLSVALIQYLTKDVVKTGKRVLVLIVLVFSFQWLDVIPELTPYGFGWGELSMAIKDVATLMERDSVLNMMGFMFFFFSFIMAIIMIELFVGYEKSLSQIRLIRKNEKELQVMKQSQIRDRAYREMQYLVHDLKRPLTTVVGLADVIEQTATTPVLKKHSGTILKASERMNQMISEIIDSSAVRVVSLREAIEYTLTQIRPLSWSDSVVYNPSEGDSCCVRVNLIRFSRAIVNLLDNSHRATEHIPTPDIVIKGIREGDFAIIEIRDNGSGIEVEPEKLMSNWGSTGLGLAFVKEVVEVHGGFFSISSSPELGTVALINLPISDLNSTGGV